MEHQQLYHVIQELTGVYLTEEKKYLLESRLGQLMQKYNLKTYDEVALKLISKDDSEFFHQLVDKITTHETRFFRDESIFDALVEQMIPEWLERNQISRQSLILGTQTTRLNIWSIGCSYGQEPYSIAISIKEHHPYLFSFTRILATDISRDVIERAKEGIFTDFEMNRGMPEHLRQKFFTNKNSKEYQIKEEIKKIIEFKIHNLISDPYPNGFDMVFCRNVLIYFDLETRKQILEKIKKTFRKEGILILGSSENLINLMDNFIIREFGIARYYEFTPQVTFFTRRKKHSQ